MLMDCTPDLDTQPKVAKESGVSQRSVSNLLKEPTPEMKAPRLDIVEKVAGAFGRAAWQMLLDPKAIGQDLFDMLFRPATKNADRRLFKLDTKDSPGARK